MRKILSACVLVLALCAPAFAGDIPMVPAPQPPPPGMKAEERVMGSEMQQNDEPDSLTETVLSALESVFALF